MLVINLKFFSHSQRIQSKEQTVKPMVHSAFQPLVSSVNIFIELVHVFFSYLFSYRFFFEPAEQTSTTIVGTVPDGATKFTFTEGTDKAVTYIKTGSDGMLK